jgi:TetR/AcrR family transcriptional repressor of nem operon
METELPLVAWEMGDAKGQNAREKLLAVAFDLIWTHSYGSVGVDEICKRAGVHKGSFYHYFRSKADLTVAAYDENWRERQPILDKVFSPLVPPLDRLKGWCEHLWNRQKEKALKYGRVCGCPYGCLGLEMATQEEKIRAKIDEFVERYLRYLESALVDADRAGLVSIDDPRRWAVRLYSAASGTLLQCKIRNSLDPLLELEPTIMAIVGAPAQGRA